MNILAIIVLLVLLLFTLNGFRRGFIKTFVSMVSLVVAIVLVSIATPYVTQFLKSQTPVYSYIEQKCEAAFGVGDTGNRSNIEQAKIIEDLKLPSVLQQMLKDNNNENGYEKLAITGFAQYVSSYMANLIMNIVSFVATLLLVIVFLWLTVMTLGIISNIPIVHGINQVLGLGLGFAQGLAFVWIAFLIITMFSSSDIGRQLMLMIYENNILSFLYDKNILLKVLMDIMSALA